MGQEEGPLIPTKIKSSSKYESEGKTDTSSTLFLLLLPTLPPPSLSLLPTSPHSMS